ncbi:ECF transporter S component [Neobittarella massiliensis]|uniref:Riboflavin transporter n=2 Tax=Oscillospiraceae TaxID=216572 RepID=A0A8J6IQ08_9FIRM|nr:ECF transporter S component [Neobittarella massiliensis]MBC3516463.1 ECF transporter S component [Neobittarella massiliensis]SCJ88232.1 Riboflavin ECF transporter S component RibU [uncultured Anaerotruncus sp.]
MQRNDRVRTLTYMALFAAISTLLMYIEMPLPFLPPFLKLDISGAPILLAAFLFGPWQAVGITLVKDLVHLLSTQTGGVGELADFLMLASFALLCGYLYRYVHNRKGALISLSVGTVILVAVGALSNWFLLIPFYSKIMPIEAIVGACQAINKNINSIAAYIWVGVVPFNLIKGVVISLLTFLLYKRLSGLVHRQPKAAPTRIDKSRQV